MDRHNQTRDRNNGLDAFNGCDQAMNLPASPQGVSPAAASELDGHKQGGMWPETSLPITAFIMLVSVGWAIASCWMMGDEASANLHVQNPTKIFRQSTPLTAPGELRGQSVEMKTRISTAKNLAPLPGPIAQAQACIAARQAQ